MKAKRKGSNGKLKGKTFISQTELDFLIANQIDRMSIEQITEHLKDRLEDARTQLSAIFDYIDTHK